MHTNRLIFIALSLELNAQSSAVKLIDSGYSHRDLRILSIVTEILLLYKFNLTIFTYYLPMGGPLKC